MFMRRLGKIGQSTAEYAVVLALVVGAVVAMQIYVKRGIQGRMRNAVDHVSAAGDVGGTTLTFDAQQYEPYYMATDTVSAQAQNQNEVLGRNGQIGRSSTQASKMERASNIGWGTNTATVTATAPTKTDAQNELEPQPATPTVVKVY